jgi:hypothetical protein
MSPETRAELQELLFSLCDDDLSEDGYARLENVLAGDAECRRLYLEYVDMHARLLVHPSLGGAGTLADAAADTESPSCRADRPGRGRHGARQALRYGMVAAAAVAATVLVQVFWGSAQAPQGGTPASAPAALTPKPPGAVATLTQAVDCVWKTTGPERVGVRLLPGTLGLQRGIARIRFDSGPELVVEGPADLRLESSTSATVVRGKVVFRADETAPPFDLHTPASTLVDLGTEYAVAVGPQGEEVHVFDGEVQRTPNNPRGGAEPEHLKAGQARLYGPSAVAPGRWTALDPSRFVRRVDDRGQPPLDPAAGLLAYEGFDYADPEVFQAGRANGGSGWNGPWLEGFVRPLGEGDRKLLTLNAGESLLRPGARKASVGGCFDYTGFTKYYRRLAAPIRLDVDATYYLSFLFRRHGPPMDPVNAVAVLLWTTEDYLQQSEDRRKRLNIGVRETNQLFTHLEGVGAVTPLPLSYGETYLLVAKIVAAKSGPDQVFMRVYGPEEPVERDEAGNWSLVGPPFASERVFDWLQIHVNSKTRQTIDEVRLGTTWLSVTAPWTGGSAPRKETNP